MLPIDIINKILFYVSEINNNIIITQYHPVTNKECYKIDFNSDLLWRIKSTLIMKRIYPLRDGNFCNKCNIELYKFGIPHYEMQLRKKKNL
jgi:hypothetical protein